MRNVIRNNEAQITHLLVGIWDGNRHFLAEDKYDLMQGHVFEFEDMLEADAEAGDALIVMLLNGDMTEEEIRYSLCRQLRIFSDEDVIIEQL